MKSKPMGALFGVLALVAILSAAPAFGQTANEVDMAKGAGASQTADCVAANNCFNPNPLTVAPGTQVTWKNTDTVSHTVTSGKPSDNQTGTVFDSGGLIKPGGTFQFTFQNAGTYDYFCVVHPWMIGKVIVGSGSSSYQNPVSSVPQKNLQCNFPNAAGFYPYATYCTSKSNLPPNLPPISAKISSDRSSPVTIYQIQLRDQTYDISYMIKGGSVTGMTDYGDRGTLEIS